MSYYFSNYLQTPCPVYVLTAVSVLIAGDGLFTLCKSCSSTCMPLSNWHCSQASVTVITFTASV